MSKRSFSASSCVARRTCSLLGAVVRDVHVREDVFQEIALTRWRHFDRYDPSRPFGAWARGVAAKKLLERFIGERRLPLVLLTGTSLCCQGAAGLSSSGADIHATWNAAGTGEEGRRVADMAPGNLAAGLPAAQRTSESVPGPSRQPGG